MEKRAGHIQQRIGTKNEPHAEWHCHALRIALNLGWTACRDYELLWLQRRATVPFESRPFSFLFITPVSDRIPTWAMHAAESFGSALPSSRFLLWAGGFL